MPDVVVSPCRLVFFHGLLGAQVDVANGSSGCGSYPMEVRRSVLHEVAGTVQTLAQIPADGGLPSAWSLI